MSIIPSAESIASNLATAMTKRVCNEILEVEKTYGPEVCKLAIKYFISLLVGNIIYRRLMEKPEGVDSQIKIENHVLEGFADIKMDVQEAVSNGVSGAMTKFTGRAMEYYCLVKTVPEVPAGRKVS